MLHGLQSASSLMSPARCARARSCLLERSNLLLPRSQAPVSTCAIRAQQPFGTCGAYTQSCELASPCALPGTSVHRRWQVSFESRFMRKLPVRSKAGEEKTDAAFYWTVVVKEEGVLKEVPVCEGGEKKARRRF